MTPPKVSAAKGSASKASGVKASGVKTSGGKAGGGKAGAPDVAAPDANAANLAVPQPAVPQPVAPQAIARCGWAAGADAAMQAYHDTEWGVPLHDDAALFELLILEGAQAGLSWRTILARRQAYRDAFHDFDLERVAGMTDAALQALLTASGIIRHRQKVFSARGNAQAALRARDTHGSLDAFLWRFVDGTPVVNRWTESAQVPATSPLSDRMSKALKQAGFTFVGSTICYSFMQATGMVNDHLTTCFRHAP